MARGRVLSPQEEGSTSATFSQAGAYTLRLTATDGSDTGHDYVAVDVLAASDNLTISNAATLSDTDLAYDGCNLTVNAATLTVNGLHHFNTVTLLNGDEAKLDDGFYYVRLMAEDESGLRGYAQQYVFLRNYSGD